MSNDTNVFVGDCSKAKDSSQLRLAVKDNIDLKGYVTSAGSCALRNSAVQTRDAAVITAIRSRASLHIVGKTILDEFAAGATGENTCFGDVLNPFDPARMSGGSSSGSAVAIASDCADVALGTDTGGSVRIPAALCGIASLKTTIGTVSTRGVYPLSQTLDTVGPMGRRIVDVISLYEAMTGNRRVALHSTNLRGLKIGRLRFAESETIVDTLIDAVLRESVGVLDDVVLSRWAEAHGAAYGILSYEGYQNNRDLLEKKADQIGPVPSGVFNDGLNVSTVEFGAALKFKTLWTQDIEAELSRFDFLVSPTVSNVAPRHDELDRLDWGAYSRTMQFNLSGHPAVNVPVPVPEMGLSVGLQIVGPLGSDRTLLAIAQQFEAVIAQIHGN